MNIDDLQPWVADLLVAWPDLAGVPVLIDDGTYPMTPGREAALTEQGLVLIVWQPDSEGLIDDTQKGTALERVIVPIVIEENLAVNAQGAGTGISAMAALRHVRDATIGRKHANAPGTVLTPADPPFRNFRTTNGVQRIVAMIATDILITPKPAPPTP